MKLAYKGTRDQAAKTDRHDVADPSRRSILIGGGAAGAATAVAALMYGASPAAASPLPDEFGVSELDSFAGSTDDAKLTAALSYVSAQSHQPAIGFRTRSNYSFSANRNAFSGLRLLGPDANQGPKNLELSGGKFVAATINYTGSGAWWTNSTTAYDVFVSRLAVTGNGGGQFWASTGGNGCYSAQFDNLTLYGFQYGFGNPASKFLNTQCLFTGHWTVLGFSNTQFSFGGSDSQFWMDGYLNINSPSNVAGAGRPMIIYSTQQKSQTGFVYATAQTDWAGLQITGNGGGLNFFGGVYEGRSASTPATRAVIDVQGGDASFFGPAVNYTTNGAGAGAIAQSGGNLSLYSPSYLRASGALGTDPFLYQTAGNASMYSPNCRTTGETLVCRWSDGSSTKATRANKVLM